MGKPGQAVQGGTLSSASESGLQLGLLELVTTDLLAFLSVLLFSF